MAEPFFTAAIALSDIFIYNQENHAGQTAVFDNLK
jgi:hypothetical protein